MAWLTVSDGSGVGAGVSKGSSPASGLSVGDGVEKATGSGPDDSNE